MDLALVQRSIIWFVFGLVVLGVTFSAAIRLLARTDDDRNPTIVGALVLKKAGETLAGTPLYTYVGDVKTRSAVIGIGLSGGSKPITLRVLFSNIKPDGCIPNGVSLLNQPQSIGPDTAFYSFHQAHVRDIFMFDVAVPADAKGSISCNVTDPPERETYVTRRIAFSPPTNKDILAKARAGGFEPVWPVMANIQRVTESTGFTTFGGRPVHDNAFGSITEASYLTLLDPVLRAYWSDEPSRSWQTFWLFFLAVVSGLGAAMLLEAVRPWIERIGT